MRIGRAFVGFFLAILAFTVQRADAADWMRLRSAHFTVEGDVGAGDLRMVAGRLEQFREVIGRALPGAKLVTPAPITVVVFGHAGDMKALAPRFEGKPIALAGFAMTSPIGPSIVICIERRDQALSVAYHEFTHLLVANLALGFPTWLDEGLAEFYGAFEISDDGRRAILGKPVSPEEVGLVQADQLPMSQFLAATKASKLYNVSTERNLFYAQSWAFVHYLLMGNPERKRQFTDFLARLSAGTPADAAFAGAFLQPEKLETELSSYVRQFSIRVAQITFDDRVAGATDFALAPMTPAEARAAVGLELVRQQRFEEARVAFEWALAHAPDTASAHTGAGLSSVLQGRVADGLGELQKGAELADGDAMAHFAYGYGALQCSSPGCSSELGSRETARREFQRAVDLQPQFPEALAMLGWAEAVTGRNFADAERHFLQAIAFLPGREDYRFNLAQLYLQQENDVKVQELLGPIAAASPNAENKARARQLLGTIATMRAQREARKAAAEAEAAALAATPPSPVSERGGAGNPPPAGAVHPVFRVMSGEEKRLDGVLETILCPAGGAVIVTVRNAAGAHRFSSPALPAIDFITYRDDLKGSVTCGPQRPAMRVYLTWRPAAKGEPPLGAGIEGRIVAIEFLPKSM